MKKTFALLTAAALLGGVAFACNGDDGATIGEQPSERATPAATEEPPLEVTDQATATGSASPAGPSPASVPKNGPPDVSGEETITASGLRIIEIEEGSGESPRPGQTVAVKYSAWLEDGTKLESTVDLGRLFEFSVGDGQVLAGLNEGILMMRIGGKLRLLIPPELAYGPDGLPPTIPPNATLIFDVELLDIR